MENDKFELEKFKTDINLIEYAIKHGYCLLSNKSKGQQVALQKDEDVIIIVKNKSNNNFIYINPSDPSDKGTIIDFVKSRKGLNLGEIRKELRAELSLPVPVETKIKLDSSENTERSNIIYKFFSLQPLTDRSYLHSRGIEDETIDHPFFKGKIGNNNVELLTFKTENIPDKLINYKFTDNEKDALKTGQPVYIKNFEILDNKFDVNIKFENEKITFLNQIPQKYIDILKNFDSRFNTIQFTNTVFPIINEAGIIGIEQKNTNYKGTALGSNKKDGIFISNLPAEKISDTVLVIGETAIDLLSYHQLVNNKKTKNDLNVTLNNKSVIYVATNGELTKKQVEEIQKIIDKYKPVKTILANDNDLAGHRFNLNLACQLTMPREVEKNKIENDSFINAIDKNNKIKAWVNTIPNKKLAVMQYTVQYKDMQTGKSLNDNILKVLKDIEKAYANKYSDFKDDKLFIPQQRFSNSTYSESYFVFPYREDVMESLKNLFIDIRLVKNMVTDKAINKDFNEDLKQLNQLKQEKQLAKSPKKQSGFGLSIEL